MARANGDAVGVERSDPESTVAARLFAGPGEMRARCRALDWAATPLGPVEDWPQSLRTAVSVCLASGFPKLVMWGPELVQLYNDAFVPILQAKHPAALGQRARDCWPELWDRIGPMYRGVLETGASIFLEDQLFQPERRGEVGLVEEAYFTFSYSAIPDESYRPAGILATVVETTRQVQSRSEREAALERANAALRAAAVERERLLAESEQARARAASGDARYRALLDALDVGFCVIEVLFDERGEATDYRYLEANRRFWEQSGLPGDMVGRRIREVAPNLEAHWFAAFGGVARTGEPTRLADHAEGLGRWFDVFAFRVDDPALRRVAVLFTDVSKARGAAAERERLLAASEAARADAEAARAAAERAAVALARSEARFRTVQDASPHGLVLLRPVRDGGAADAGADDAGRVVDFRIRYVNPAGARLTGQPRPDAMVGHTLLELFPATRALGLFDAYVEVIETGVVWEDDVRYVADGLAAGYRLAAVRAGEGAEAELVLLYADATARLAAEAERDRLLAELGAERERLRSVILHAPSPLALLDGPEHRFALVNDAYKRISGGGRDVTGLTPPEAFPELAGSGIYELFDQVYATGVPWDGPESLVRYDRDGTGVQDTWFNLRFEPVRDAEGRVVAILNFAVDVTEQVRARQQVEGLLQAERAARAEAEGANRAKSEFLAVMSHELRTPLNAIGGYTELIELGIHGAVTPEQRTALARIQQSQRHLLGLIAGVLDYSRVEAGAVTYRIVDVPVTEAVAEAETLVAPQLRAKGLGYAWSGAAPDLRVRADREKLQQILLNLLGNAIKFTDARDGAPGRIEVACTVEAGDGVAAGGRVQIHVRDTGEGIDPDQLERVFEPFVQADQRLTRPHAGVGLGLAISRDLARGMGGDITAGSTPGVGSTFTLTLPATHYGPELTRDR